MLLIPLFALLSFTAAKLPCSKKICWMCKKDHLPTKVLSECERFLTTKCCYAYGYDSQNSHGLTLSTSDREVIPPPKQAVIKSGHGFKNKTVWLMLALILIFVFLASAFEKVIILSCSRLSKFGEKPN